MNKISVNEKETEMIISKSKQENFELWGKRLYPTESFKNLVLETDASHYNLPIIFPLDGIQSMFSFLKRENTLVLKIKIHLFCYF